MKILVTAFEPFNNQETNSSLEVLRALESDHIIKLEIPTVKEISSEAIIETIKKENPHVVLSLGQAQNRDKISIERIGINVKDYPIKDNEGNQPQDLKIKLLGDVAYFSTLPIKTMQQACLKENIPTEISNTAGTFVCNEVMYTIAHYVIENKLPIRTGFIHVPTTESMDLETMVKAIEICIDTLTTTSKNMVHKGGFIS